MNGRFSLVSQNLPRLLLDRSNWRRLSWCEVRSKEDSHWLAKTYRGCYWTDPAGEGSRGASLYKKGVLIGRPKLTEAVIGQIQLAKVVVVGEIR
jgi:hypothetical protein